MSVLHGKTLSPAKFSKLTTWEVERSLKVRLSKYPSANTGRMFELRWLRA